MIINIRGTGGSGKSTIVKNIMALYPGSMEIFAEGRKRPMAYVCTGLGTGRHLFVPGHYETPTGGCDTIQKPDDVFQMVETHAAMGMDVLFEGIMIGDDVRRTVDLNRRYPVHVVALNTSIAECLTSIQGRRNNRGDERPLDPKNTEDRDKRLRRSMIPRLKDAGVKCLWATRDEAFTVVKNLLGLR